MIIVHGMIAVQRKKKHTRRIGTRQVIIIYCPDCPENAQCIDGYHSGKSVKCPFILGAAWRINSVWHRADERPEDNRAVLAIGEDDYPVIAGPNNEEWEGSVEYFGITAWAYVDDLLPDTFDDILEANKDVLERIKQKGD